MPRTIERVLAFHCAYGRFRDARSQTRPIYYGLTYDTVAIGLEDCRG